MRQNAITGAPIRSEPKLGNACACRPSRKAASASSSAAVTTPCPPRPWMRTSNTRLGPVEPPAAGSTRAPPSDARVTASRESAVSRADCSRTRRSAAATSERVRSMTSMLTEIASMPARTSRSAYSGCTEGAWPQIEVRRPELARPRDQLAQVGGHGRVALVERLGEHLVVTVGAEHQLGEVVRADRDARDPERRRRPAG